jgi:NADH-quinone oxidoreductase subunit H
MTTLYLPIVAFIIAASGTLALGLMLRWVDRKVTALVQWRVGPPWYQPLADVLKLMGKENMMPVTARGTLFMLAPIIALSATGVAAAVLWAGLLSTGGFVGDLIVVIYLLMIPAIMTILGASASGNPHAAIGASREVKLLLSYELPLILAMLVAIIRSSAVTGQPWSLRFDAILAGQSASPCLMSISGALAIIVAIICMQAKLGQVPFDLAEAECEIMSGVYVEYSGANLAMFLMTRAMLLALVPLLLIIVFWGGLYTGAWWGVLTFMGKYLLLVTLVTLIRNTNPRLRIDQAVRFFWFVLTPLAIVAVILAMVGANKDLPWL